MITLGSFAWVATRILNMNTFPLNLIYTKTRPQEVMGPSLEILGYDILQGICQLVDEAPSTPSEQYGQIERQVGSRAKTSRMMRDISAPSLFKEVIIRGKWAECLKMVKRLKECPNVMQYIKCD